MDQQETNWVKINEEILKMEDKEKLVEGDDISYEEWKNEWNKLIDQSKKIAGCLRRERK